MFPLMPPWRSMTSRACRSSTRTWRASPTAKVKEFKSKIRAADGILMATPENNYSIPGVLKNALNVASRPYGDNSLEGKPVAIMGASMSLFGTARVSTTSASALSF